MSFDLLGELTHSKAIRTSLSQILLVMNFRKYRDEETIKGIVMEKMDESLEAFLEDESKKEVDVHSDSESNLTHLNTILEILHGVTKGMAYLEQENVVHRDLRTSNVLLKDEGSTKIAKIGDFGLSKFKAKYNYYDHGYQVMPIICILNFQKLFKN